MSINELIKQELERAESIFPKHHSAHESYAILSEELEELANEFYDLDRNVRSLWSYIKCNKPERQKHYINELRKTSLKLTEEAIQVCAMIERFDKDIL